MNKFLNSNIFVFKFIFSIFEVLIIINILIKYLMISSNNNFLSRIFREFNVSIIIVFKVIEIIINIIFRNLIKFKNFWIKRIRIFSFSIRVINLVINISILMN